MSYHVDSNGKLTSPHATAVRVLSEQPNLAGRHNRKARRQYATEKGYRKLGSPSVYLTIVSRKG